MSFQHPMHSSGAQAPAMPQMVPPGMDQMVPPGRTQMTPPGYTGPPIASPMHQGPQLYAARPPLDDPSFNTFLQACEAGDFSSVTGLAEGAARSQDYLTLGLNKAAGRGHTDIAEYLLGHGAVIDAFTAIKAAQSKSLGIFEALLRHGWDPNNAGSFGSTVLPMVADSEPLVRCLLDHGADPNIGAPSHYPYTNQGSAPPDTNSGRALNAAAASSTPAVFDLLLERGARLENSFPLHNAAGAHDRIPGERIPMMEYLLQRGVDVNGLDDAQFERFAIGTPLHYAARWGRVDEARFLLEHGADPHTPNRAGFTALDEATRNQQTAMVELLQPYSL